MWLTLLIALIVDLVFGNGVPHFVNGISKRDYPCILGNGPIPNLLAGWLALNIAGALALWQWSLFASEPVATGMGFSLGVLAIGLFHAGPGAFGHND